MSLFINELAQLYIGTDHFGAEYFGARLFQRKNTLAPTISAQIKSAQQCSILRKQKYSLVKFSSIQLGLIQFSFGHFNLVFVISVQLGLVQFWFGRRQVSPRRNSPSPNYSAPKQSVAKLVRAKVVRVEIVRAELVHCRKIVRKIVFLIF